MKRLILLSLFVTQFTYAQNPSVKISDHHGTQDVVHIDCDYAFLPDKKIQLTANFPEIRETNSYEVEAINHSPIIPYSAGNKIDIIGNFEKTDDVFSDVIALPFEFCFYGSKHNNVIISDNGVVSFDIANANGNCAFIVSGTTPNTSLPKNSILGVFHDLKNPAEDPTNSNLGEIRTLTIGTAPNRQFIINYDNLLQFDPINPPNYRSTFQIVLYETTNRIEIFVQKKQLNPSIPDIRRRAAIGLTNQNGTSGIAAPERNTGIWEVAETQSEAWAFVPNGSSNIDIKWFDEGGNLIGTSNPIEVSPTINTSYKAIVTYNLCSPISVEDTIEIEFSQDFPTANDLEKIVCLAIGETGNLDLTTFQNEINPDSGLTFSFHTSQNGANNADNSIPDPTNYSFTSNDHYVYVKVLKSGICFSVSKIRIKANRKPSISAYQEFSFCDAEGDNQEIINLNNLNISGLNWQFTKQFYPSENDAIAGANQIINVTNYLFQPIPPNPTITIYVKAWNTSSGDPNCATIAPIILRLKPYMEVQDFEALICFVTIGQTIPSFDLTQYENNFLSSPITGATLAYYRNSNLTNLIPNPTNALITLNSTIYVKVSAPGYCDTIAILKITADDDCDGNPGGGGGGSGGGGGVSPNCDVTFPFIVDLENDYLPFYLPPPLTLNDITILGFFSNSGLTNPVTSPYTFNTSGTITVYVKFRINSTQVETSLNFPVSASSKAVLDSVDFDFCDVHNDNSEFINLNTKVRPTFLALYNPADIYFFTSVADLNNYMADPTSTNPINSITITNPITQIYVLVRYFGCWYQHEINLNLIPIEEELIELTICDFNSDNQENVDFNNYIPNIYGVLTSDQFSNLQGVYYYHNLTQAHNGGTTGQISDITNFNINATQMSVFVRLEIDDQCPIIVELRFSFSTSINLPEINLENTFVCDLGADNQEEINLNSLINTSDINSIVDFYTSLAGAETENSNFLIGAYSDGGILNYTINSTTIIYIRVLDTVSGCVNIMEISLNLVEIPRLENNEIDVCDVENDDLEIITLDEIKTQLIANNSTILDVSMEFILYDNQTDAINDVNNVTEINVNNSASAWVKITSINGNCSDIFELQFNLIQTPILQNISVQICNNNTENDNDEIYETINLDNYKDQILGFPFTTEFEFSYFNSATEAQTGTNPIAASYIVTTFPTTIYVRVLNQTTGCYSITDFTIEAIPTFEINPVNIEFCSEGELNGIVNLHEYAVQLVDEISAYTITFHESKTHAINDQPFTSDISNFYITPTTIIWVKIVDNENGCVVLHQLPVAIFPSPKMNPILITECDENLDNEFNFNLDDFKSQWITGEPNVENLYNFEYEYNINGTTYTSANLYFSYDDMVPGSLPNTLEFVVNIKATNADGTTCFSLSTITFRTSLKVPLLENEFTLYACDSDSTQGFGIFDLTEANLHFSSTATFTYHATLEDAQNSTNEITDFTTYENPNPFTDTIYVRINENGFCDNLAIIHLVVSPFMQINDYVANPICEFNELGENTTIDLESYIPNITAGVDSAILATLDITFYHDLINAQNATNPINQTEINNYNFSVGTTILYIRFDQSNTGCFTIKEITLEKLPAPIIENVADSVCDDDLDGNINVIFQDYNDQITNQPNVTISYHLTSEDAWNGSNALNQFDPYHITNSTIFYVRTSENSSFCVNVSELDITTEPTIEPIFNFTTEYCFNAIIPELPTVSENGISGTWSPQINNQTTTIYTFEPNSGQCGERVTLTIEIMEPAQLNEIEPIILCDENFDGQFSYNLTDLNDQLSNFTNLTFQYFSSISDLNNNNPIPNLDLNNYSFSNLPASIWVTSINENGCQSEPKEIQFIEGLEINLLPAPFEISYCPDIPINLQAYQTNISIENNVNFSYYNSFENAINQTNQISNSQNYTPNSPGIIYVRLYKTGFCAQIVELNLIENPEVSHNENIEILSSECGANQIDLTIYESIIGTETGISFIYFENLNEAQNQINPIIDIQNFQLNNANGYVYVRLEKEGKCPVIIPIEYAKAEIPTLEVPDTLLICDDPLEIEATTNLTNVTFDWYWGDNQSATGSTLTVSETGVYTVVVTTEFGCTEERDITISSTGQPQIISVEAGKDYIVVYAIASQGGHLEYSLNGVFWQDSPRFSNLTKGETYDVYVREANCKIEKYKVTLLDIPNFISPNGDGYNDTWKIRGVEHTPNSTIRIFDRYGKVFVDTNFKGNYEWDGRYLGRVVPTSDYWYIIHIPADGIVKELKYVGHVTVRNHINPN